MKKHGNVTVSMLGFRFEGRWLKDWSKPFCCFLTQETLLHIVSLHPDVQMGPSDKTLQYGLALHSGGGNDPHMQLLHAMETGLSSG